MTPLLVFENFTQAYYALVDATYNQADYETAPRGMKIRENLFTSFVITNPRDRLLYVPERNFPLDYVMAEILWYISANNETDWISNYSSFWKNISDDGVTANSAYGARIFVPHERIGGWKAPVDWNQWDYVKEELKADPDSRRAVIHIRTAQDSFLAKKDVPCTLNLQFFIRDEKLHLIVQMRSNDLILGTALDVPAFTFMQEMMAMELGLDVGFYYHTSNSMHVYERHYQMCEDILKNASGKQQVATAMPKLPGKPPIDALMMLEEEARKVETHDDLVRIGNTARLMDDPLWTDWAHILCAHRAKKLGLKDLEKWFYEGLSTACFKELCR
jgi:thymidylate synthase